METPRRTFRIDDKLYEWMKQSAAERGFTLTKLLEVWIIQTHTQDEMKEQERKS